MGRAECLQAAKWIEDAAENAVSDDAVRRPAPLLRGSVLTPFSFETKSFAWLEDVLRVSGGYDGADPEPYGQAYGNCARTKRRCIFWKDMSCERYVQTGRFIHHGAITARESVGAWVRGSH